MKNVKEMLSEKFKMKDLGKLKHFLGIDFSQTEGQVNCLKRDMSTKYCKCKNVESEELHLSPNFLENSEKMKNPKKYREAVGSLLYLSIYTRPDLSYVVSRICSHFAEPTEKHWTTVRHVFRYLKGTSNQELTFKRDDKNSLGLRVFTDADWALDSSDRRSTTGFCVSLSKESGLISWKTRKQQTVALSTCEAEYVALAAAMHECLYLEQVLQNLDNYKYAQAKIYEDNQGTLAITKNPVHRQRCKCINIKYTYFSREIVNSG